MPSPIDKIYKSVFGNFPNKPGSAYEQLVAIAMFLLEEGDVRHDLPLRGQFSKSLYQIDVYHESKLNNKSTMAEAKDYSERGGKVGRADLQKLGGALPDIKEISRGAFFSATGYTKPAKQYAQASTNITGGKSINLYELAVSKDGDEKGFIKTIIINADATIYYPDKGNYKLIFTQMGEKKLKDYVLKDGINSAEVGIALNQFYDASGTPIVSMAELTSTGYADTCSETEYAHACYWLPDHYILFDDFLYPINGLEFKVPTSHLKRQIVINDDSEHRLVLKDQDGVPIRILTDRGLREFSFDTDGKVVRVV